MRIALSWLKRFLDTNASIEQICDKLTSLGFEVEEVINRAKEFEGFIVAEIISTTQHPDADRLKVCQVNTGSEILEIVCGASNARAGIKVALALTGCIIPNGKFQIKKSKIRGVVSNGMLCSYDELNLEIPQNKKDFDGIIELDNSSILGQSFAECIGFNDVIIEISITPNRGDALSVLGLARELIACKIAEPRVWNLSDNNKSKDENIANNIEFKKSIFGISKNSCSQIYFIKIDKIKNIESPDWIKHYLQNVGIKTISAVVDIVNYVAHSLGQPMHAYDDAKILNANNSNDELGTLSKLKVDFAIEDEEVLALDNKSYKLSAGDIVIRDRSGAPQAIAGIIGSLCSGCSMETSSIVLESAVFDPIQIFKTGSRLNIHTDSRMRFERGVDSSMSKEAIVWVAKLIQEICGGEIVYAYFDELENAGSELLNQDIIKISDGFINKKLGTNLGLKKIVGVLEDLKFGIMNKGNISEIDEAERGYEIEVAAPSFRHDIKIKEDIVEEVARIIGYDEIHSVSCDNQNYNNVNNIFDLYARTAFEKKINPRGLADCQKNAINSRRILASLGYNEVITWSFMDSNKSSIFSPKKEELVIANPISNNLDYMRETILPNLLDIVSAANTRSIRDVEVFEIGPVFGSDRLRDSDEIKSLTESEPNVIAGIKTSVDKNKYYFRYAGGGVGEKNSSKSNSELYDFYTIKGDVEVLLSELEVDLESGNLKISDSGIPAYYHQKRAAAFSVEIDNPSSLWQDSKKSENKVTPLVLCYFGQINPKICKEFDIKDDVFGFEIFLNDIAFYVERMRNGSDGLKIKTKFKKLNDYQVIERDFCFIIDKKKCKVGEILDFIKKINHELITKVELFDMYESSIAVRVFIQPISDSFSNDEITELYSKIIQSTEEKFGCKLKL